MVLFPNCKINLGLRITAKRNDGFHDLETVFFPLPVTDILELIPSSQETASITMTGIPIPGDATGNLVMKAYELLKKDFPFLPSLNFFLHKILPTGAGLGGGSADGAFALIGINKWAELNLSEEKLLHYALQLGSDAPFFIINRPCIGKGRGEQLAPIEINLSAYQLVLVHPGIQVSTPWAFSQIRPKQPEQTIESIIQSPVISWKDQLINDFEPAIFLKYPEIAAIKKKLYEQGAVYASMSGSGSAVFGLFEKTKQVDFSFPDQYFVRVTHL